MKTEPTLLCIVALCCSVYLAGCGGGSAAPTQPAVAPAPAISSLSPSSATAGGPQFTLTVNGANFVLGAVVTWNGNNRVTTFVSSTQLSATILASDIATTGSVNVAVVNPPNSVSSNILVFGINAVTPVFAITPSSPAVRVNATVQFSATAQVTWSVQEGAAGGTISSAGTYTAPQVPGLYHVIATAVTDSSKTASASVLVTLSGFTSVGNLASARLAHTATLLPDGRVLVAGGGQGPDLIDGFFVVSGAELFDPATASFTSAGTSARDFHTATLLQSRQVLLAGGEDTSGNATSTAELYDPNNGSFHPTGSMSVPREFHTATLLKDGKVLIVGGDLLRTAEIYDPTTGVFSVTGSMNEGRSFHAATLLADGRVLITGGCCPANSGLASAEVYDPASGSFTSVGAMMTARWYHTATLLPDGKVLVTGSVGASGATAEVYDPVTASFTPTGSMFMPRVLHSATLLLDGTVLIAGGTCFNAACASTATAEIYDPAKGAFIRTADLTQARFWHTATLFPDGRVLFVGGADSSDGIHTTPLSSAEIYK